MRTIRRSKPCALAFATTALILLTVAAPAWAAEAGVAKGTSERLTKEAPQIVPGEIIVKLKTTERSGIALMATGATLQSQQSHLDRLAAQYGLQELGPVFKRAHRALQRREGQRLGTLSVSSHDLDLTPYYVVKTDGDVMAVCAELAADPDVEYAQPNYSYHICQTPNDPDFPDQYAHRLIQMEDAWDISTGSRDVVIAVIDTGVDVNHPDLKNNIWTNEDEIPDNDIDDDGNGYVDDINGWNFGRDDNEVAPSNEDASVSSVISHGTEVSGVIGAVGNNDQGVVGVNWQCSIMGLRLSLDFGSDEIADALDYAAANGARVVNMSFGGDVFGPEGDLLVQGAIDNAYAQGVLLVASAGNADTTRPNYPAAYPNVMSVASTNGEDMKTGHSTFGPWLDIAAPGTDIVTTDLGGEYIATAGTSFSAPYVAAVAGLVIGHRPDLSHAQTRAILENTADPVDYGNLDPNLGYIGTGRVNAYQALLGADLAYPLGEIAAPIPTQTYAPDVNTIDVEMIIHGQAYQLDCRPYGQTEWTLIDEGIAPADPDGHLTVALPNPGVGTYELRLRVTRDNYTHIDRKVFGIQLAQPQAHWPKPAEKVDPFELEWFYIGNPICMDVDGNGTKEIIALSLNLYDYWDDGGSIDIWDAEGNPLPNWPVSTGYYWPTGAAVGDIDGDGDFEIVIVAEYDNVILAYHVESGEPVGGEWPAEVGTWSAYISGAPALADLDGDGDSEIIVALDDESGSVDGLYALQGDGTAMWQRRYISNAPVSVGDIDEDGDAEIGLCGYGPGLNRVYTFILDDQGQQVTRWRGGSPKGTAIADIDADGVSELVFCTDEAVMATRADGSTVWETELPDALDEFGGLAVGDVDGDGYSEVYVTTSVSEDGFAFTRVYGLDHEGNELQEAGFPKTVMGDPYRCPPLIADIDGDGKKELIVAVGGEPIMAWEADGSVTPGFPLVDTALDYEVTPVIDDLDQDGDLEFMAVTDDYRFHVLDLAASTLAEHVDWGMARKDPQNSGWVKPAPRIDLAGAPSTIKPGEKLQVQLTASNPANLPLRWSVGNLPEGAHYDPNALTLTWKPTADQAFHTYTFSFLVTDGVRQDSRTVTVEVASNAVYYASMDTDPGWTLDEGWAWGTPTGDGSWKGDPNTGYTGDNVIGYALDGDYTNDIAEPRYATTGAIDCTGYTDVRLGFRRWLGLEAPYDQASVQVSNDGQNWTDLWTPGMAHISESDWQYVEYAVPATVADGQPTVFFRWGLGPTDGSVTYPGWNIDDVQVTGNPVQ